MDLCLLLARSFAFNTQCDYALLLISWLSINKDVALITTEGPAGVSKCHDRLSPISTATEPIMDANNAICSGDEETLRAVAAGIIRSEVMINAPTNFIPTAITTPTISINTNLTKSVFTPSTAASSSLTVLELSLIHI